MRDFAKTPRPPYYAVIFSSARTEPDPAYDEMAAAMEELARRQPGCFGLESVRDAEGFGITTAYFADEAAIFAWKAHADHVMAQKLGKERWYRKYHVRIAKVERAYDGP
jgi:heme-degrading monooxygenase HmoA